MVLQQLLILTNTTLDDNLLELNSGATSNANDTGIIMEKEFYWR